MAIEFFIFWMPEIDLTYIFNIMNMIFFFAGGGIFLGIFFGIFHPTAALTYEKADSCKVIG